MNIDDVDALHAEGVRLVGLGRLAEGEALLARACVAAPARAILHNDLAAARRLLGRLDEARDGFRRAGAVDPGYAEAWHNLGLVELARGDAAAARPALERAIALAPAIGLTHLALGVACGRLGEHLAAARALGEAARLEPDEPRAWTNLALALVELGRPAEAVAAARRGLALAAADADAQLALGIAAAAAGEHALALVTLPPALAARPERADGWTALSLARRESGDGGGAVAAAERALRIAPGPSARAHLARAHLLLRQPMAALRALGDDDAAAAPETLFARARAHQMLGNSPTALACYRRLVALAPCWPGAISGALFLSIASEACGAPEILALAGDWARSCLPRAARSARRRPAARRRIGYVSPDFCRHAVAFYLRPLLEAHDPESVEIFLYATGTRRDDYSAWFAGQPGIAWRDVARSSADDAAARIVADGIDVLVDLAGHTEGGRLDVFARRPAPVQASWLGWPGATGLDAIDWRVSDEIADPPAEETPGDRVLRLADGFHVWRAPEEAPALGGARDRARPPTFGSFNQALKLSPATIALWARILAAVPAARLLVKCRSLELPEARTRLAARFAAAGIAPSRVELLAGSLPLAAHFALYERVDVALDPFPYNGTTTTLEALWMGVPVVTLGDGDRHAARIGMSLLTHAGYPELIARDDGAYVAIAATLVADLDRLDAGRRERRERLAASPLLDARGFARKLEAAFAALG